jgi:SulP family sulfate permease
MHKRLEPKPPSILREGYTLKQFYFDLGAGLTVGVVALPLAMLPCIRVKPEQGLAILVAGFVIAVPGGSRADQRTRRRLHRHHLRSDPEWL